MIKAWARWVLISTCLFLTTALFFQNCGPAKLSSGGDAASTISNTSGVGSKVDLDSLLKSPQEPASNVLFPSTATVNEYDYALSAPIIENVVLKSNDFSRIEWIHAPSATIVALGDAFNQVTFSEDRLGPYYIIGYRDSSSFIIGQIRLISKGTTTLNVNSVGALQLGQQVVSSDSLNEDILVTMDAPSVDLSTVKFNVTSKGLSISGKRAFLLTKKLSESVDVELSVSDTTGQSATKTLNLPSKTSTSGPVSCNFNGQSIASGTGVTAFQAASVPYGSSCVSQTRTCTNGTLSGTYQYSACTVAAPGACAFNGNTVSSGVSVTAFQSASVPYGSSCASETRTCTNGTLSGSYQYSSCSVTPPASCSFNGQTITSGSNVTAYQASSVPYGSSCTSQIRTCSNGTLSGSYQYSSCSVSAAANCTFNGQTVANGSSITAYQSLVSTSAGSCYSQIRTCTNGTLSGSYQYSTCTVSIPTSCTFNGQTVASGSSVTAYQASSVLYGYSCYSESRTCSNGTLSGSYQYSSCSVATPSKTEIFQLASPNITYSKGQSFNIGVKLYTVPLSGDYHIFIHFVDSSGVQHSDMNGDIVPSVPTNQWSGLTTFTTTIYIPATAPSGTYTIRAGLYLNVDPYITRASLLMGPGVTVDDQTRYTIGTLTVP